MIFYLSKNLNSKGISTHTSIFSYKSQIKKTMAPGCSISNDQCQSQMIVHYQDQNKEKANSINTSNINFSQAFVSCYDPFYLDQIPLPSTPAPIMPLNSLPKLCRKQNYRSLETVDSFEILEQTIMKQKRLGKNKNNDLRTKVLLKRTFNLVCEMMDEENGLENNLPESDTQDKEEICQNTLIINLNESETLDLFQNEENDLNNFIELENFNYENLLENENINESTELDKNKSFLSVDFFSSSSDIESQRGTDSGIHYYDCSKRRRSSADDDYDFDETYENDSSVDSSHYFTDLTNSSSKKRTLKHLEVDFKSNSYKKFKESFNLVT